MSINKNKLAIIIPVFNEEDIIEKVINDWLFIAKKFDGFIIVINDGSSDNSLKILKRINKKSNRLIIINKKNIGIWYKNLKLKPKKLTNKKINLINCVLNLMLYRVVVFDFSIDKKLT